VEDETRLINRAMALQQLSDRDANLSSLVVPLQPLNWPAFPHLALPVFRPPHTRTHNTRLVAFSATRAGSHNPLAQAESEYHSSAVAAMAIASATAPWRFAVLPSPNPCPSNTARVGGGVVRGSGELTTTHHCLR
jgi:hypothetical protein